jgi:hypothetical protein
LLSRPPGGLFPVHAADLDDVGRDLGPLEDVADPTQEKVI